MKRLEHDRRRRGPVGRLVAGWVSWLPLLFWRSIGRSRLLSAWAAVTLVTSALAIEPYVPNDPYYFPSPNALSNSNSLNYCQWYLNKSGTTARVDINVAGAWARGLTGKGVVIGIIEGPVQFSHPDLVDNLERSESWNFFDRTPTVVPPASDNMHGTSVAGLMAACGGNRTGMTGVAPHAKYAVLNVGGGYLFDDGPAVQRLADAMRYHSNPGRATIPIKNNSQSTTYPFASSLWQGVSAIESAIRESHAAGCITVIAAGNSRLKVGLRTVSEADANKLHNCHLPEVIVTTAVGFDGRVAAYANFGASITCAAPSRESEPTFGFEGVGVLSTDLLGADGYNTSLTQAPFEPSDLDYARFGGTSATAPIVSGALALAREVQPNLTTRMAKHLLARTCRVVNPGDSLPTGGWTTNRAGFHFNNNYGFGLIDVDALTTQAPRFTRVTPLVTDTTGEIFAGNPMVRMNDTNGLLRSCVVTNTGPLEEVQLRLKVNFGRSNASARCYGQLGLVLVSPSGTRSVLSMPNPRSQDVSSREKPWPSLDWTYSANAFWGENPAGKWRIILSHPYPPQEGTSETNFPNAYVWNSFELITRSGRLVEASSGFAEMAAPQLISNRLVFRIVGPAGRASILESSRDLVDWSPVATNTLAATPLTMIDPAPASRPQRFYRARLAPEAAAFAAAATPAPVHPPSQPPPEPPIGSAIESAAIPAPAPAGSFSLNPDVPVPVGPPGAGVQ